MPPPRSAPILLAAALLGLTGPAALALTQPTCAGAALRVCALPSAPSLTLAGLDLLTGAPPQTEDHGTGSEGAAAPPARPVDLLIRHGARATQPPRTDGAGDRSMASYAPPRRPVTAGLPAATDL